MRKYAKAVVNLLIALVVLLLIIFLAPRLIFFFMPFVVGWLIALIASPLVVFFEQKLKVRRQFGGVVVIDGSGTDRVPPLSGRCFSGRSGKQSDRECSRNVERL